MDPGIFDGSSAISPSCVSSSPRLADFLNFHLPLELIAGDGRSCANGLPFGEVALFVTEHIGEAEGMTATSSGGSSEWPLSNLASASSGCG
jgi:hypothetical protein